MALTPKQQRFVAEYLIDLNATQAAIRAGYDFELAPCGFYTYFLINPTDGGIFYVGKGKGTRMQSHAKRAAAGVVDNAEKFKRIKAIHESGNKVLEIVFSAHVIEEGAYTVERDMIHALRDYGLTNISGGIVSNSELVREQAKVTLAKLMPFEQWHASATKKQLDWAVAIKGDARACYDFIRDSIVVAAS